MNFLKKNITVRQKKAFEAFGNGNYKECITILSETDLDDDFEAMERQLAELQIKNAEKYIAEHTTAIKILHLMTDDPTRHSQIKNRFNKIIPVAKKYRV